MPKRIRVKTQNPSGNGEMREAGPMMATKDQPIEWQGCPKCGKLTLARTGIDKEGGRIMKYLRCQTCGHEMKVQLSN